MTVRGTVPLSPSDFLVLYPRIFSLLYKATANSHRAILVHVNASLEFLKLVTSQNIFVIVPRSNEELLKVAPLDELLDERKPINENGWRCTAPPDPARNDS
jgi:platelet-activating factor acetylhydrolase